MSQGDCQTSFLGHATKELKSDLINALLGVTFSHT